eukprot:gene20414-34612_t
MDASWEAWHALGLQANGGSRVLFKLHVLTNLISAGKTAAAVVDAAEWEELTDEQRYQQLLRQSLIELPKATTSDHPMAALEKLEEYAGQEGKWVPVVLSIVPGVPLSNPLSSALIAIVIDVMPTPNRSDLGKLAVEMHTALVAAMEGRLVAQLRNGLIALAVVAARHAGHA